MGSVSTIRLLEHEVTRLLLTRRWPNRRNWSLHCVPTRIDGKVYDVYGYHGQNNGWHAGRLVIVDEPPNNLACEAQYQKAGSYNDGADNHEGPSTTPFRLALVGDDTYNGLDDQA